MNTLFSYVKTLALTILLFTSVHAAQAQSSAMNTWQGLLDKPQLAIYFSGIFDHLGVIMDKGQEKFTVHHKVDHFELSPGLDQQCDYVVNLNMDNVNLMKEHGRDSKISNEESYMIMRVLFSPLTKESLKQRWLNRPFYRWLSGVENHTVVYLESPATDEYVVHTLLFINKQWLVLPGVHGTPKRTIRMSPEQAVDYQRHIFAAMKTDKAKDWRKMKKWYMNWRKEVTVQGLN